MKAMSNLALLAALGATIIATVSGNTNHHRQRRSPGPHLPSSSSSHHRQKRAIPAIPFLLAYKSGGSGAGPLPPHVDPNIGQSSAQLNSMSTSASMSGPLATMGVTLIITSAVMAANYFQAVNAKRRSYIQKRSTLDINQEFIISLINSFR